MNNFSMEVPNVDNIKEEIVEEIKPAPKQETAIDTQASSNADELINLNVDSLEERTNVIHVIDDFGKDLMRKSSSKNELLQVRMKDLQKLGGENGEIVSGLSKLQMEMKGLDPSSIDFNSNGLLSKIVNPVKQYFAKYQKADNVINDIITSLENGKKTLNRDNVTLEIEQQNLKDITKQSYNQYVLGKKMDDYLNAKLEELKANPDEAERVKFIEEEIVFPLEQRLMDLEQVQIVNQQGIVAMEVLRKNNKELIRAVERAQNVTVSALRVAVTVASALYNQKIVLEKVNALNKATENMITGTASLLKSQGAEIQKRSMESTISVDALKQAFTDTFDALDQIDTYKHEALPKMKTVISEFEQIAQEGKTRIEKMEKASVQSSINN